MIRCKYKTNSAEQCHAPAMTGRLNCWFHDPECEARRKAASSAGGKSNRRAVVIDAPFLVLRTRSGIREMNQFLVNALCKTEIDPALANSASQLGNILLRALKLKEEDSRLRGLELLGGLELGGLEETPDGDAGSSDPEQAPAGPPAIPLRSVAEICDILEKATNMLLTGQFDPHVSNAIGCVANNQLRLISIDLEARKMRLQAAEENRRGKK